MRHNIARPDPPVRIMRAGQVWLVNVERRRHINEKALDVPLRRLEPHLVLVLDPRPLGWPVEALVWWRSKLRIGALWERDEADIWKDLRQLRWHQSPPYIKNYTSSLRMDRKDPLYWEHPVEWPGE